MSGSTFRSESELGIEVESNLRSKPEISMEEESEESEESEEKKENEEKKESEEKKAGSAASGIKIVFTDVDGTIVHYPGARCIEVAPREGDLEPVATVATVATRTRRGRNASAKSTKRKAPGKSAPENFTPVDPSILRTSLTVEEWEHADTEGVSDIFEDDLIFCPRPTLPCHMKKRNVFSMRINGYTALVTFSTSEGGDSHTMRNKTPMVMLPPSSSGATGYISAATLGLFDQVRARGAKVVMISGCRYSTLMQRLQFLPSADAYVCESGGRIFYRDHNGVALWEDVGWRYRMMNSGQIDALGRCMKACRARFAKMRGVKVDDDSYSTAFRVRSDRDAKSGIDIKSAVLKVVRDQKLEDELSVSVNLGCVDVYPKLSGKRNAAAYVSDVFGGWELGEHAAFFCDDDNDIELAMEANRVFMPGMSENLAAAVMAAAKSKDRVHEKFRFIHDTDFTTYRNQPFQSTETLLLYLLKELDAQLDQRRPICLAKGVADRDQLDEGGLGYCQCCGRLQCKDKAGAHGEEAPSLGTLALMIRSMCPLRE